MDKEVPVKLWKSSLSGVWIRLWIRIRFTLAEFSCFACFSLLYRCCDCAGTNIDVKIESHVGLTVSRCSFLWTADFTGRIMLKFRAIQTAGSASRILTIKFSSNITATVHGCPYVGYELPDIRVINNSTAATTITTTIAAAAAAAAPPPPLPP